MDPRAPTSLTPRDLRCDAVAPWLWRIAWSTPLADLRDDEREAIAQVATSRASGALVVLAPPMRDSTDDSAPFELPEALLPVTGPVGASLELETFPPAGCGATRLFAPRGRGRVVMALRSQDGTPPLDAALASRAATAKAHAFLDDFIADFAARTTSNALPRRRPSLDGGELVPAERSSRDFAYAADGDALFLESADGPIAARRVMGGESFTLRPTIGGKALAQRQLVIVRATAPADRGALLRVFLDDLDLGPWRLGDTQPRERTAIDLFRVSSDLLAGREELHFSFKVEGGRELASLRWWFLHEEEPAGLWLTELEPTRFIAPGGRRTPADRAADGNLLVHDDQLFLRGLWLAPGARVSYASPRGERLLCAQVAAASAGGAALVITTGAATRTRIVIASADATRHELSIRLAADSSTAAADELEFAVEGDAPLLLLAPKLLR